MIQIAHEAPISIMGHVKDYTDYCYALVHLFEEQPEYLEYFKKQVSLGRKVLLDNSIFELGEAFDPERYAYWINELRPDEYIIPDVLEDTSGTILSATEWLHKYRDLPGKKIGVIQGTDYAGLVQCYKFMDETANVDKIAISFDYSYYEEQHPHPNKWYSWLMGRVTLLGKLMKDGVINTNKPHHLLGVGVPGEGKFYAGRPEFHWIESIDTSNPVVHGIKGIEYQENWGLDHKESQKLFEMITTPKRDIDLNLVIDNISEFNSLWNH